MDGQYFAVRGEKRYGLLIDPGAASGLVGSDTLRQLLDNCVKPAGKQDEMTIDYNKTVPVSGINGVSENTLGQISLPLNSVESLTRQMFLEEMVRFARHLSAILHFVK